MPQEQVQALEHENAQLRKRLREEEYENALLRRVLFMQHEKQPRMMRPLQLPISERAVILFEVLPDAFGVEAVFAMAERLGIEESEAAEHLRTYLQERMLHSEEASKDFVKTGRRPYLREA